MPPRITREDRLSESGRQRFLQLQRQKKIRDSNRRINYRIGLDRLAITLCNTMDKHVPDWWTIFLKWAKAPIGKSYEYTVSNRGKKEVLTVKTGMGNTSRELVSQGFIQLWEMYKIFESVQPEWLISYLKKQRTIKKEDVDTGKTEDIVLELTGELSQAFRP